jgi:hypothetical protein
MWHFFFTPSFPPPPAFPLSIPTPPPGPQPPFSPTIMAALPLLQQQLQQALAGAGEGESSPEALGPAVKRLFDHVVKEGNVGGLAWLLDDATTPPAARAVLTQALLNDLLDVAATEAADAGCVAVLLRRGADPVGNRPTPTLLAVLNRLRFVLGSRGCGTAGGGEQGQGQEEGQEEATRARRLLAVVEVMVGAMSGSQLDAQDYRHFTPLSFSAFYALEAPARWLICAGADAHASLPFHNHNAIEWCVCGRDGRGGKKKGRKRDD